MTTVRLVYTLFVKSAAFLCLLANGNYLIAPSVKFRVILLKLRMSKNISYGPFYALFCTYSRLKIRDQRFNLCIIKDNGVCLVADKTSLKVIIADRGISASISEDT